MTPAGVLWKKLGFCDCGNPEDVLDLVRRALQAMVDRKAAEGKNETAQHIETTVLPLNDPNALLLRYVLDAGDLTWHGGSVHGSRPSETGLALLTFLTEVPQNEWMDDE